MLKGKWALVTGATAGLGLAVAESLAGAGANIVLHDLVEPTETRDRLRHALASRWSALQPTCRSAPPSKP